MFRIIVHHYAFLSPFQQERVRNIIQDQGLSIASTDVKFLENVPFKVLLPLLHCSLQINKSLPNKWLIRFLERYAPEMDSSDLEHAIEICIIKEFRQQYCPQIYRQARNAFPFLAATTKQQLLKRLLNLKEQSAKIDLDLLVHQCLSLGKTKADNAELEQWLEYIHHTYTYFPAERVCSAFLDLAKNGYCFHYLAEYIFARQNVLSEKKREEFWRYLFSSRLATQYQEEVFELSLDMLNTQPTLSPWKVSNILLHAQQLFLTQEQRQELVKAYMDHPNHQKVDDIHIWDRFCTQLDPRTLAAVLPYLCQKHLGTPAGEDFLARSLPAKGCASLLINYLWPYGSRQFPPSIRASYDKPTTEFLLQKIIGSPSWSTPSELMKLLRSLALIRYRGDNLEAIVHLALQKNQKGDHTVKTHLLVTLSNISGFEAERHELFQLVRHATKNLSTEDIAGILFSMKNLLPKEVLEEWIYSISWHTLHIPSMWAKVIVRHLNILNISLPLPLYKQYAHFLTLPTQSSRSEKAIASSLEKKLIAADLSVPLFTNVHFHGIEMDCLIPFPDGKGYLNVECDGIFHTANTEQKDRERDAFLAKHQIEVIRFSLTNSKADYRKEKFQTIINRLLERQVTPPVESAPRSPQSSSSPNEDSQI